MAQSLNQHFRDFANKNIVFDNQYDGHQKSFRP